MPKYNQAPSIGAAAFSKGLYKTGAAAALFAALIFRRNLDAEFMLLRNSGLIHMGPATYPQTVTAWFTLLQQNKLIGMTLLNVFDLVNYALVGLIFLALAVAFKKDQPVSVFLATALGLVGTVVYFATNRAFTMLALSNQYAAAVTQSQRAALLVAGQKALNTHQSASYGGTGIYLSFLLVSTAGLIIAFAMLRSPIFKRPVAYTGILAHGFGLGYYLVGAFSPALVYIPLSIAAIFLLAWYLQISFRLWALGMAKLEPTITPRTFEEQQLNYQKKELIG